MRTYHRYTWRTPSGEYLGEGTVYSGQVELGDFRKKCRLHTYTVFLPRMNVLPLDLYILCKTVKTKLFVKKTRTFRNLDLRTQMLLQLLAGWKRKKASGRQKVTKLFYYCRTNGFATEYPQSTVW